MKKVNLWKWSKRFKVRALHICVTCLEIMKSCCINSLVFCSLFRTGKFSTQGFWVRPAKRCR
jgi:hypothetical protein